MQSEREIVGRYDSPSDAAVTLTARPDAATWREVLGSLRPGGYLVAAGPGCPYHRLACSVEDAGFEVRDCLTWLHDDGTGSVGRLPILLARKPGKSVLPLGVDECRVPGNVEEMRGRSGVASQPNQILGSGIRNPTDDVWEPDTLGRWPANVLHDNSPAVLAVFAAFGETSPSRAGRKRSGERAQDGHGKPDGYRINAGVMTEFGDTGTAARFFYAAETRLSLARWLVRLVTPPGGTVLSPFADSGVVAEAATLESRRVVAPVAS